ncbi:MAG: PASTA domain-containing protein, partial [Planctomycetia bacterium]|nr:PASTA domain-containing protein [Planctomycetia bacterium]
PKLGYHWGGTGAAPVFKRVMERIINLDDSIKIPEHIINSPTKPILADKRSNKVLKNKPIQLSSLANDTKFVSSSDKQQENQTEIVVPNVRGMSLKKAINILHNSGLKSKFAGSGTVVWQSPKPGAISTTGTICSIGLE